MRAVRGGGNRVIERQVCREDAVRRGGVARRIVSLVARWFCRGEFHRADLPPSFPDEVVKVIIVARQVCRRKHIRGEK
jgi:hypothetical protein